MSDHPSPLFIPGQAKPEADYLELERLGAALGIPTPQLHLRVEATLPDGSPGEIYAGRARTWNRNFWNFVLALGSASGDSTSAFGAGYLGVKNMNSGAIYETTGYTARALSTRSFGIATRGSAGVDTGGILVGTGATAESFEAYSLAAKCAEGTTVNRFNYAAMVAQAPTYNSGTRMWTGTIIRVLSNNSAATIVVAETCLSGNHDIKYGGGPTYSAFMYARDLLGATVSVLPGGILTVTYTVTLTFPA